MENSFKFAVLGLILLLTVSISFGFEVKTIVPQELVYGKEQIIAININTENTTKFDVVEILPYGWEITNWTANVGNVMSESKDVNYNNMLSSAFRWKFDGANQDVVLTYTLKPTTMGQQKITTVWTYPEGFGSNDYVILVKSPVNSGALIGLLALIVATAIMIGGLLRREYEKMEKLKRKLKRKSKAKVIKKKKIKKVKKHKKLKRR